MGLAGAAPLRRDASDYYAAMLANRALGDHGADQPRRGERVLDGGTVTVVLSLGQERYSVPKLRGPPVSHESASWSQTISRIAAIADRMMTAATMP